MKLSERKIEWCSVEIYERIIIKVGIEMNILVAFSDNYSMPTRVMLMSLIKNNSAFINIYVLYMSLTDDSISELSTLNTRRSTLHFIQIDEHILDHVPVTLFYSKEAYIRLFAHVYLPEAIDRILWLDSDVIINGDIQELYYWDFDDKLYIAYKDPIQGDSAEKKASLGMPEDAQYINSGVLLMNLEEIRHRVNEKDIKRYIRDYYDKIIFVDQDVFNGLLYDSIKVIESEDYTYNYFVSRITLRNRNMVYQNVRIIHYAMGRKPWKKKFRYFGFHLWWKYALMTDNSYKKIYRSIYPSYSLAKSGYLFILVMQKLCPRLYNILRKIHRKKGKKICERKDYKELVI